MFKNWTISLSCGVPMNHILKKKWPTEKCILIFERPQQELLTNAVRREATHTHRPWRGTDLRKPGRVPRLCTGTHPPPAHHHRLGHHAEGRRRWSLRSDLLWRDLSSTGESLQKRLRDIAAGPDLWHSTFFCTGPHGTRCGRLWGARGEPVFTSRWVFFFFRTSFNKHQFGYELHKSRYCDSVHKRKYLFGLFQTHDLVIASSAG